MNGLHLGGEMRVLVRRYRRYVVGVALGVFAVFPVPGQNAARGNGAAQAPVNSAPSIDITGYWVSVVTEDWRYRMVTPRRGEYPNVPVTEQAKKVADAWDPAKDTAAGEQCKAYGAPGVMRLPTRLHITWEDAKTLKVEADNGTQTRYIHVLGPQATTLQAEGMPVPGFTAAPASWQGDSVGTWETPLHGKGGSLKVVTRNMKPGYLQKNGVPYSSSALLTEYFDRLDEPNGDVWLVDLSSTEDPQYLRAPFIHSTHFKREPNGSKWDPSPCSAE